MFMRIILDTNFLIDLSRYKIDLENINMFTGKKEIITLDLVVKELNTIAISRKRDSKYAKLGLKLINLHKIKILPSSEKNVDKALINLGNKNTIIATNDAELRKKLRSIGVKTIYLRAKKRLELG